MEQPILIAVLVGVSIFVIGQIVLKFFIEPIHALDNCIGQITYALIFYANVYGNPVGIERFNKLDEENKKLREETINRLRNLASELNAKAQMVRWYKLFEIIRIVPKRKKVEEAARSLIGLSNSVISGKPLDNQKSRETIFDSLGISDM